MDKIFPDEFSTKVFEEDTNLKQKFIEDVTVPYVKKIIYSDSALMNKSPIGAYINKYFDEKFNRSKSEEECKNELNNIMKSKISNTDERLVNNISNYIYTNIMNNKYFKDELVHKALDANELQRLGKVSTGFNSMVESMTYKALQMIELKSFPYGEYASIKNTFNTTISVLKSFNMSLNRR